MNFKMKNEINKLLEYFQRRLKTRSIFNHCIVRNEKIQENISILKNIRQELPNFPCIGPDSVSIPVASERGGGSVQATSHRKKILIVGWYGAGNFGDELMLYNLTRNEEFKNCEISVIVDPNFDYPPIILEGIKYYYPPKKHEDLNFISSWFDQIIIGGGAQIDDTTEKNLSQCPYLAIELSVKAILAKKIVRWISVSSNKNLIDKAYIEKLRFVASNAKEFSIRDNFSIDSLKNVGICDNVSFKKDLAFDYEFNFKTLIITLVPHAQKEQILSVLDEAKHFVDKSNNKWKICILPFFIGNNHDHNFIFDIVNNIDFGDIDIVVPPNYNSIDSMMLMMKSGDIFINMRYHATLISLALDKPTISFCTDFHPHYPNKMTYLSSIFDKNIVIKSSSYIKGQIYNSLKDIENAY